MALDGAAESWFVKVAEKVYGPYTRDHMARFVAEGRVKGASLVALSASGEFCAARAFAPLQAALNETRGQFKSEEHEERPANLLVFADIRSGGGQQFEYELHRLGAVADVGAGLYLVRTHRTAGVVRNALSPLLSRGDRLLVLDATRDRLAWFNLGPETDARIRGVWNASL